MASKFTADVTASSANPGKDVDTGGKFAAGIKDDCQFVAGDVDTGGSPLRELSGARGKIVHEKNLK